MALNYTTKKTHISLDLIRFTFGVILYLTSFPKVKYQNGAAKRRHLKGRAVIACNHISYHDGIIANVVWLNRRVHILTKPEVLKNGFMRVFLKNAETVVVDPDKFDLEGMRAASQVLKDESVLVVFPQGHIKGDDIGDLKGGASFFAKRENAPIIPMYVTDVLRPFVRNVSYIGKTIDTEKVLSEAPQGVSKLDYLTSKVKEGLLSLKYMYNDEFLKKHKKKERWECVEPKAGDHIRVLCEGYYHHGLYFDDNTVVQFGTRDVNTNHAEVVVNTCTLESFLGEGNIEVRKYGFFKRLTRHSVKKIKKIAMSKVGSLGYNITHNNCEHLCYFSEFGPDLVKHVDY